MTGGDYARRERDSASNSLGSWHTENDAGALDSARGGPRIRASADRVANRRDTNRSINPSQKIPVLQDGEFTLTESAAIVTYVGGTYGTRHGLLPPPDTKTRAKYYQWCFFLMMEFDANALYVLRKHTDLKAIYGEAPNAVLAARKQLEKQAQVVSKTLAARGPFILGESFTGADILLTTCLVAAMRREIELPDVLVKYLKRITRREAYKQALVVNQPP